MFTYYKHCLTKIKKTRKMLSAIQKQQIKHFSYLGTDVNNLNSTKQHN